MVARHATRGGERAARPEELAASCEDEDVAAAGAAALTEQQAPALDDLEISITPKSMRKKKRGLASVAEPENEAGRAEWLAG